MLVSTRLTQVSAIKEIKPKAIPTPKRRFWAKVLRATIQRLAKVAGEGLDFSFAKTTIAGIKVRLNSIVSTIPIAVNKPNVFKGTMSIQTNDSNPAAVVKPAAVIVGARLIIVWVIACRGSLLCTKE